MKNIEDINFRDEAFPLIIGPSRTSSVSKNGSVNQAIHEVIEIKCFYEGESTLLIGNETVHAKAGDIIVINPYEFHTTVDYGKEDKGKYHLFMMGVDFFVGARAGGLDLRHLIFGKRTVFKTKFSDSPQMYQLLIKAVEEYEAEEPTSQLAIFGIMAQVFAYLLKFGTRDDNASPTKDVSHCYAIIEPALRIIRDEYATSFDVDKLASECKISKFHFCRLFKEAMGMSAIQYLNNYRLKIADTLLSNTDKSISEIAALCGFEDTSYFCKLYKRLYGKTPKNAKH